MSARLGIPSKGRLMEKTIDWFGARGVGLSRSGSEREYAGAVEGVDGVDLALLPAGEIPRELAEGRIHLGVTGSDLALENLGRWEECVEPLASMGFGYADLVIAVPQCWVDVDTLDDLDGAAASFREAHGERLRIATKYSRMVREFLKENGVADYLLVHSEGATEGAVTNGSAEAIADITSSGKTLRANRLKTLSDGLVHRSQATLYRARSATPSARERESLNALLARLGLKG